MHQVIRATASAWERWACSMEGARSLAKGMRVKPQWARRRSMVIAGISLFSLVGVVVVASVVILAPSAPGEA